MDGMNQPLQAEMFAGAFTFRKKVTYTEDMFTLSRFVLPYLCNTNKLLRYGIRNWKMPWLPSP